MKKKCLIFLSVLSVGVLIFLSTCNPYKQNDTASSSELNELDNSGSARLTITCTVAVNGSTYDGGGETIVSQVYASDEVQYPAFNVTSGTVKNVTITYSAGSSPVGLWLAGNCSVDNITIPAVGDGSAAIVKKPGISTVSNMTANNAADEVLRINDICTITYQNITADKMVKMVRQNGGNTWKCTVYLDTANLTNTMEAVVRSDSLSTTVSWRNITCNLAQSSWWYGNFVVRPY